MKFSKRDIGILSICTVLGVLGIIVVHTGLPLPSDTLGILALLSIVDLVICTITWGVAIFAPGNLSILRQEKHSDYYREFLAKNFKLKSDEELIQKGILPQECSPENEGKEDRPFLPS